MLLEMFLIFFKIGAFTFGGGFAMIPIIQEEIVEKKAWIKEDEFLDAIIVSQSAPGPVAVNLSVYTGHKLAGIPGMIVAVLGTVLPSFLIILVVARYLYQYRNNPMLDRIFAGITPGIVGLVLAAVYKLKKSSNFGMDKIFIAVLAFLVIAFFGISPIYLIIVAGLGSVLINKYNE